ncbi:MAG: class I SAM-dependent methyltransferase [Acidimicrobiales bacterium]|nr:class I SAM-dependent methyltransferase [Acidimicrobiales bacterium]
MTASHLVLGRTAPVSASRTAGRLGGFALQCVDRHGIGTQSYLDVGCGNGFITRLVGDRFESISGIDVEPERLDEFRLAVTGDDRYRIHNGSAASLPFGPNTFDLVTSFEVLEHVDDLDGAVRELVRVVRPHGLIVISTPQAWFPLETHGMRWRGRDLEQKIPLLPYVRPLHRRLALARVFTARELDRRFAAAGCAPLETAYASPQFERQAAGAGTWESKVQRIRPLLDACERIPVLRAITGVSLLKAYRPVG